MAKQSLGLYIHVPFCVSKCAYCDFYSLSGDDSQKARYVERLIHQIDRWGRALSAPPTDTLYFGGGTPSLLSAEQITAIIDQVKRSFCLHDPEITLEVNPAEDLEGFFVAVGAAGVNRISIGMQSALPDELQYLSRRHTAEDVTRTVSAARSAGIERISLDLMLGIPGQTEDTLRKSIDFAVATGAEHISAYLLSLEPGTPLFQKQKELPLPDADRAGALYLAACSILREAGYERYEISNFAKNGAISRHNTKYWMGEDYLGLGPAAHSMVGGKRFYYPRDIAAYLEKPTEISDGTGGGLEEVIMLRLRLASGLSLATLREHFSVDTDPLLHKAALLARHGLLRLEGEVISLTDQGAVVSNAVITELLAEI